MSELTQGNSSLMETVDLWETIVIDQPTKIESLVLEVESGVVAERPPGLAPGETMTVGRTTDAKLTAPRDKKMSREHFSIKCCEDRAVVRDLNSTNGTFVNGISVSQTQVYDGDQIVAGTTTFTIRLATKS